MSQIVLILLLLHLLNLQELVAMELIWVMFGFFILVTITFVVLAVAFPEWFGITGKRALEIHKHQEGDSSEDAPE